MKYIIKGDIVYNKDKTSFESVKNGYLVCENGISQGVYESIPDEYKDYEIKDYSNKLIIPGMVDLHIHAPQYSFRGLWMDMELLDWLNFHTFPEEAKYADLDYADKAYDIFVNDIKTSATTRAVVFGTLHVEATDLLMEKFEKTGLITYVGKVNMDRNSPDILTEENSEKSFSNTLRWLEKAKKYNKTKPIITPRFIPSCSDELMVELGKLVEKSKLKLQSHLSENQGEIMWIKELCPESKNYADAYDNFNLFGSHSQTIMAHCVWCEDDEIKLLKERDVFVAHCPTSNANLSSGIAPIRKYLNEDIDIGIGTDVAAGTDRSMFKAIVSAIQMSKMYWRLVDDKYKALTMPEAVYLATKGGGKFFGKVGSFEKGYELDALILDESNIPTTIENLTPVERLERFIYLADDRDIQHKIVFGEEIF